MNEQYNLKHLAVFRIYGAFKFKLSFITYRHYLLSWGDKSYKIRIERFFTQHIKKHADFVPDHPAGVAQ